MKKIIRMILLMTVCMSFTVNVMAASIPAWTEIDGIFYNDKGEVIENAVAKGIDVSHHQGAIDWEKVSKTDIQFAIIRCGYGNDMTSQDDTYFKSNIAGCEKYGIPYGIYIYSYATNKTMAQSEANHVLRLIHETNANPTYPIWYDMEDSCQANLTAAVLGNIAETFCNAIISAGYDVGVYANLNWWNTKLTDKRFDAWKRWVAQYNSYCLYEGEYVMWQFTSQGTVDGIDGNTDLNIIFYHDCNVSGHSYTSWTVTKKSTCTETGTQTRKCTYCGNVETSAVSATGHNYKWVYTKKPTALQTGTKKKVCQTCGYVEKTQTVAKLKATGKLNRTRITLKCSKRYTKLKVKNLAKGDGVKSYKSSNKYIARIGKKGIIATGKKKGTATITVTLKSGKKLKLKVNVKK